MIRFTIITITYNAEAVVGRTLDSVLQQTHEDVEPVPGAGLQLFVSLKLISRKAMPRAMDIRSFCGRNPMKASTMP